MQPQIMDSIMDFQGTRDVGKYLEDRLHNYITVNGDGQNWCCYVIIPKSLFQHSPPLLADMMIGTGEEGEYQRPYVHFDYTTAFFNWHENANHITTGQTLEELYYLFFPGYVLDERYLESVSQQDVGRVKVDTMCSEVTSLCFSVVDLIKEEDGEVRRAIYVHGFEKEFDTLVTLIPPKGMSAKNSDTRMWSVDHLVVNTVSVCSLIISPFMVGALNTDFLKTSSAERPHESMLIVGLGGGALDMFIHTKFPSVQIDVFELDSIVKTLANKWFDVVEDRSRKTIIQDGIAAIKEASSRGDKHNVVVIDACDSTTQMPCPTAVFIQLEFLRTVKSILKPGGVVMVNVLALQDEVNNLKMVERRLLSVFPVCTSISIETEFNSIYACLAEDIHSDRLHSTAQVWTQRRKELQNAFGFAQKMHDIDFKILRKSK